MKKQLLTHLILPFIGLTALPVAGTPIVNGGFEQDGAGWTITESDGTVEFVNQFGELTPTEGAQFMLAQGLNLGDALLTQDFSVDTLSELSFSAAGTVGPDGGFARVDLLIGDSPIIISRFAGPRQPSLPVFVPFAALFSAAEGDPLNWQSFQMMLDPGDYRLRISTSYDAVVAADGYRLTPQTAATPEPMTFTLLAIGGIGLALSRKAKKKSASN